MKIPAHIAQKLIQLTNGETLASSIAKHYIIEELLAEGIIGKTGRIHKKLHLINTNALLQYLENKYGINDLKEYIKIIEKEHVKRSELVEISSNSKLKNIRSFKGFLTNGYLPINATLNGKNITLNFIEGNFQFIYDFENFFPEDDITIVGVENAENFRWIEKQKHLFANIKPLFVSRYPQNQNKDLIKWLKLIPNNYLHFGDFDFAGIGIYLNEYKKHFPEKSSFFIPKNIEYLINKHGNTSRYNQQKINYEVDSINEVKIIELLKILHFYKKGLDQEIFIKHN